VKVVGRLLAQPDGAAALSTSTWCSNRALTACKLSQRVWLAANRAVSDRAESGHIESGGHRLRWLNGSGTVGLGQKRPTTSLRRASTSYVSGTERSDYRSSLVQVLTEDKGAAQARRRRCGSDNRDQRRTTPNAGATSASSSARISHSPRAERTAHPRPSFDGPPPLRGYLAKAKILVCCLLSPRSRSGGSATDAKTVEPMKPLLKSFGFRQVERPALVVGLVATWATAAARYLPGPKGTFSFEVSQS